MVADAWINRLIHFNFFLSDFSDSLLFLEKVESDYISIIALRVFQALNWLLKYEKESLNSLKLISLPIDEILVGFPVSANKGVPFPGEGEQLPIDG